MKDEGPGFSETSPQKIFKRFYSNRPQSFGKHSGLGLNIAKNIIESNKVLKFDKFEDVSKELTLLSVSESLKLIKNNLANLGIVHDLSLIHI